MCSFRLSQNLLRWPSYHPFISTNGPKRGWGSSQSRIIESNHCKCQLSNTLFIQILLIPLLGARWDFSLATWNIFLLSHTYMNITKIDKCHPIPLYQFNKGCVSFVFSTMSMISQIIWRSTPFSRWWKAPPLTFSLAGFIKAVETGHSTSDITCVFHLKIF